MSNDNQGSTGGGFDFKTVVSVAALIAAGASMLYANSIDSSSKVSELEVSLRSLNSKVGELPTSDGVKQLISDNVQIPAQGPSSADVQAMIDASKLTSDDVQAQIDQSNLTANDVQAMIDANTLKPEDIQALIDKGDLTQADVQALIDGSNLTEADVQALIDKSKLTRQDVQTLIDQSTLSTDDVKALINEPLNDVRSAMGALPDEARVRELAARAAAAANRTLVADDLPGLITANAIPTGAVVAFATECPAEFGWTEYEPARGRFLVATGKHSDANGTTRTFVAGAGDNDGTYETTLTVDQMPAHRHGVERQGPTRGIEGLPPLGSDGAVLSAIEREQTLATGKGEPHNNVPPYIALHFCEKT